MPVTGSSPPPLEAVVDGDVVTPGAAPASSHPLRGIALYALGLLILACMDSTTKYLAMRHPVPVVVAVRYVVNCLLMVVVIGPLQGRKLVQTRRTGLVLLRGACLAAASLCLGLALRRMPVAETTSIVFLAPAMVVVLAGPLMGERKHPFGALAAAGGLIGVLLVAHPGAGLELGGVLLAFAGAIVTAGYQMLSRVLAASERTVALLFFTSLIGALLFTCLAPWFWDGNLPNNLDRLLLISLGFCSAIGHYLFTLSHRYASATTLAPIGYIQVVWAGILGWLFFDHVPGLLSFAGMAVIIASGMLIAAKREHH